MFNPHSAHRCRYIRPRITLDLMISRWWVDWRAFRSFTTCRESYSNPCFWEIPINLPCEFSGGCSTKSLSSTWEYVVSELERWLTRVEYRSSIRDSWYDFGFWLTTGWLNVSKALAQKTTKVGDGRSGMSQPIILNLAACGQHSWGCVLIIRCNTTAH